MPPRGDGSMLLGERVRRMSLTDGHYVEKKVRGPSLTLLVLGMAVPVSLIVFGMGGLRDRRWLIVPVVLLLAARAIERLQRKRRG